MEQHSKLSLGDGGVYSIQRKLKLSKKTPDLTIKAHTGKKITATLYTGKI